MQRLLLASWSWASCPRPVSKMRPRLTHGLQSSPATQHTHPGNYPILDMLSCVSCWPETRAEAPGVGQQILAHSCLVAHIWLSAYAPNLRCGVMGIRGHSGANAMASWIGQALRWQRVGSREMVLWFPFGSAFFVARQYAGRVASTR